MVEFGGGDYSSLIQLQAAPSPSDVKHNTDDQHSDQFQSENGPVEDDNADTSDEKTHLWLVFWKNAHNTSTKRTDFEFRSNLCLLVQKMFIMKEMLQPYGLRVSIEPVY